jgi:predicted nucleotidyltransferase
MDKIPVKITRLLKKYIEKLEENRIPIRQAVLFGSYAAGGSHEWSDIDIALVSEVFEGVRIKDRSKIRKITLDISTDLSPLPFRPEDFTPEDPFAREIIEHGIIIKEAQIA